MGTGNFMSPALRTAGAQEGREINAPQYVARGQAQAGAKQLGAALAANMKQMKPPKRGPEYPKTSPFGG
jgi:hypothetical protein